MDQSLTRCARRRARRRERAAPSRPHRVTDTRVLTRVRRYLEAGIMAAGVVMERHEGTPQGGPLSPLLANVLLDRVDHELERRGLAFVRDADDCNVYVGSKRAADRVMACLVRLFANLKLQINPTKSVVARDLRSYLRGWKAYFRLAETPTELKTLDGWIRRRLRLLLVVQCKHGPKLYRVLRARGLSQLAAALAARHCRRCG